MNENEINHIVTEIAKTPEQKQRLWEWLLHEDQLFAARTSQMLTIQSFLIAAWAAFGKEIAVSIVLTTAGILASIFWYFITKVQIDDTHTPLKEICKKLLPEYNAVAEPRKKPLSIVIGIKLPIIIALLWLVLIIVSIQVRNA